MKLRARITVAAMIVVALVTISSVIYFVERERSAAVARLGDTIEQDARLLQIVTPSPLYDGNIAQLNAILASIFANPDILALELKENRGDIAIAKQRAPATHRGAQVEREIHILRGRDDLGTVRITYTTGNIEDRLTRSRNAVVGFAVLLAACMAVLTYLLATLITRPIERLTAAARDIAQGNLQRDIATGGGGELSVLGRSFISMRDAVREKILDLADKNNQLQEEIRERASAEERFSKLFREAPVVITLVRAADGRHIDVNREFETQTGFSRTQALGRTALEIGLWEATPARESLLEPLRRDGRASNVELVFKNSAGGERTALVNAVTLDVGGEACWLVITRDVTEQKAAQEALRVVEERLQQAVRVNDMGIYEHDHGSDAIYWSPQQRRIYGFDPDEPVTLEKFLRHVFPEDLEWIGAAVQRAHSPDGDGHFDVEHRIVRKDGEVRWLATRSQTLFEGAGAARHAARTIGAVIDITARKQAEHALRQSDARLRLALQASGSGIFEHDHRNDTVYWSPEIRAIFDWRADETATMQTFAERIPIEDRERVLAQMRAARDAAGSGALDCEHRILSHDGRVRWISVRAQTLFEGEGAARRALKTVGVALDISERKEQEKALRESEARISEAYELLNDAIENAPAGIALYDIDDKLVAWNSIYKDTFFAFNRGLVRRGADFRTMLREFQASGQVRTPARTGGEWVEARIRAHRSPSGTTEIELTNGRWFQIHETLSDTGRITSVYTDITALKQREAELRESEARISKAYATLNDAIESAPAAIAIYDADDRLMAFNSRYKALFRFDEAIVRPGVDFATLVSKFTESGQVARPLRLGEGWLQERCRQHRNPQGPLEVNLTDGRSLLVTETLSSGGGVVSVYSDVTMLKQRETQLQRLNEELENMVAQRTAALAAANKELEAFAYSVSHDLRAPLRGIDGFSQVLVSQYADKLDAEARRLLQRIRDGAQHMGHLISELLALSRVARTVVNSVEVDLSALAQSVADELMAETSGRAVGWRIQPGIKVQADAGLLRIAMVNLLGNALKYTRNVAAARIEVGATRQASNFVEIYVRDNGAGFDMAYAEQLFQPFQRLHAAHEFEGTGIGLATVQRIVAKHGGTIRGEGCPGEGATFYFTMPA